MCNLVRYDYFSHCQQPALPEANQNNDVVFRYNCVNFKKKLNPHHLKIKSTKK